MIGCGRGSFELTGLDDERVIGRQVRDVLGLRFDDGDDPVGDRARVGRARARQAGRGQRGGRSARPRDGRPLSRLRRRRRPAARPHAGQVACHAAMTDRRRNLFILLLVAGAAGRVAGGHRHQADAPGPRPQGRRLARLPGQADQAVGKVTGDAIDRAIDIMRKRVDQLGVAEPEIQRSGADQIDVSLPDVKNADEAAAAGRHDRPAVLLRLGAERPRRRLQARPDRTPRSRAAPSAGVAGSRAATRYYDAVTRARQVPARRTRARRRTGDQYYLVDAKAQDGPRRARTRRVRDLQRGRRSTRSVRLDAERRSSRSRRAPSSSAPSRTTPTAKPPTDLVRAPGPPGRSRGTDIKNPEQNFDSGAGGSGQPNVTFDFTEQGPQASGRRSRARSPSAARPASRRASTRQTPHQHFAIVLDNELISVPYIDFQQNPDGIDGAQRLADLGRLHDQVRAAPRQPAEDRRAADQARAHLGRRRSRRRSASRRCTRA